jgi:hypothetical protein
MRADDHDVVGVAARRLGDDVTRRALLRDRVDAQAHGDPGAGGAAAQLLTDGETRSYGRDRDECLGWVQTAIHDAEAVRSSAVVVDDRARGSGGLSEVDLLAEAAGTTLDEGEVADGEAGEVGSLTTARPSRDVDSGQRSSRVPAAGVVHGEEVLPVDVRTRVGGYALHLGGRAIPDQQEVELEHRDLVSRRLSFLDDVVRRRVEARRARETRAAMCIGDRL